MIWPYNLVLATFLNTFHAEDDVQPGRITRFRFFMIAFVGAFLYYFLPGRYRYAPRYISMRGIMKRFCSGFLFTALSYFSWICWMKPGNSIAHTDIIRWLIQHLLTQNLESSISSLVWRPDWVWVYSRLIGRKYSISVRH